MKVAVVEDNKLLAKQVAMVLEKEGFDVQVFFDADTFLANFKPDIDILLLDINLPDIEGIEVLEILRKFNSDVKTIFMTSYNEIHYLKEAYKLGCEDYIKKPFEIDELLLRVKRVANSIQPPTVTINGCRFDFANQLVYKDNNVISITAQESKLLQIFIANKNRIVSFEHLNNKLWNGEAATNTITVAVVRLKKKLGFDSLENIRNVGYIFHEKREMNNF
jgi:DNA-binding response OmpR family regulator